MNLQYPTGGPRLVGGLLIVMWAVIAGAGLWHAQALRGDKPQKEITL